MKYYLLFVLVSVFSLGSFADASAKDRNTKMGNPTMEEMCMSRYDLDSTANAVVLSSSTKVYIEDNELHPFLVYAHADRIKVLSENGLEAGKIDISIYDPISTNSKEEEVKSIAVKTFNLEGNKIKCTTMKRSGIELERIDDNNCVMHLNAVDVQVGSVIEVEYKLYSIFYLSPNTWYAQGKYPVVFSKYSIEMPEWVGIDNKIVGSQTLSYQRTGSILRMRDMYLDNYDESPTTLDVYTASNLPALATETIKNETCTRVVHQLKNLWISVELLSTLYVKCRNLYHNYMLPIKGDMESVRIKEEIIESSFHGFGYGAHQGNEKVFIDLR